MTAWFDMPATDRLRDFALDHLYDDVDDPEMMPYGVEPLFDALKESCSVVVDEEHKAPLWHLVRSSRKDLGCAITALEDAEQQIDALEELKRAAVRPLPDTQTPSPTQTKPGQAPQSTSFWLLFGPTV